MRTLLAVAAASALLGSSAGAEEGRARDVGSGWDVKPFAIENRSAGFQVALKGYLQADFRSFRDWEVGDGETKGLRADEFEWRRLRLGLDGEWRRVSFATTVDLQGNELKDAWLGLRLTRAVQLRGGSVKLPMSPEFLTSASKTDFAERAVLVHSLGADRDVGAMVHGEVRRGLEYQAGVFVGDGRERASRAGTTTVARLVLKRIRWLEVGGSVSQGDVRADPAGPNLAPEPKGLSGRSATGYVFFPPLFVNGRRLRWGADARISAGSAALWGEFLESRDQRKGQGPTLTDLPEVRGAGWSVNATWLLTGERKTRNVQPGRRLPHGLGAVEIGVRYEALAFDDSLNRGFESAGSRAANIRPAGIRAFTGGLSWWPVPALRLVGNVLVERYDDALRAPEPGKRGSYLSLLGRVQVQLP